MGKNVDWTNVSIFFLLYPQGGKERGVTVSAPEDGGQSSRDPEVGQTAPRVLLECFGQF